MLKLPNWIPPGATKLEAYILREAAIFARYLRRWGLDQMEAMQTYRFGERYSLKRWAGYPG